MLTKLAANLPAIGDKLLVSFSNKIMAYTDLEQLIDQYPNQPYDWRLLSMNPAITFEFILDHLSLPWHIPSVSQNSNVTEAIVINNPEFDWSFKDLCANPNITFPFILEHAIRPMHRVELNWGYLSRNPMITMEIVSSYETFPWDYFCLSSNPNITSAFVLANRDRGWFLPLLSSNRGITERDIYKNVLPWCYTNLSANVNLPIRYVVDNKDQPWNMYSVTSNANTHVSDIYHYPTINWDFNALSLNPNINSEFVMNNVNTISFSKELLLTNKAITLSDILSHSEYFHIPNKEKHMSINPTITANWVKQNLDRVNWQHISVNTFAA